VLLCGGCHRLLHEGRFRLERVSMIDGQPTDAVRRYRLFDANDVEYGSRGAALRRVEKEDLFPAGNKVGIDTSKASADVTDAKAAGAKVIWTPSSSGVIPEWAG
jgi:hypothetical protein